MRLILVCLAFAEAFISPASAHGSAGALYSLSSGIAHPFSGADHILFMTFVGIWSALSGRRAIWLWPTAFMTAMLGGFAAALLGLKTSLAEPAIVSSVIVFGVIILCGLRAPVGSGAAIIGIFAFFHGHAHGTEAATVGLSAYAVGFSFATAVLFAIGAGIGFFVRSFVGRIALRPAGESAAFGQVAPNGKLP
jgi:urease accessory protein